jgi:dynein heavy chain, axonemal
MKMKNSLEGIVIKWAFQIDEVLKETSLSLFDKNNHPTPMAEIRFWENRRKNVMNLYDQLRDPRVKKIGSILELIHSVYFKTFSQTFKNVVTALHEANDITLWLKPLVRKTLYHAIFYFHCCLFVYSIASTL